MRDRNKRTQQIEPARGHIYGVCPVESLWLPLTYFHVRYALGFSLEKVAAMQEHGIEGMEVEWCAMLRCTNRWNSILQGHLERIRLGIWFTSATPLYAIIATD